MKKTVWEEDLPDEPDPVCVCGISPPDWDVIHDQESTGRAVFMKVLFVLTALISALLIFCFVAGVLSGDLGKAPLFFALAVGLGFGKFALVVRRTRPARRQVWKCNNCEHTIQLTRPAA